MHITGEFKKKAENAGLAFGVGAILTGSLLHLLHTVDVIKIDTTYLVLVSGLAAVAWAACSVDKNLQHDHAPATPGKS